jgi:magnesium transporter
VIECVKTFPDSVTRKIDEPEPGCWVNVVSPTSDERQWLKEQLGIVPEFVKSALDEEESSHVDYDDDTDQALIIIDCPAVEDDQESDDPASVQYETQPLSFLFLPEQDMVVTVSLRGDRTLDLFSEGRIKHFNTNQRTRFLLRALLNISQRYLACLRSIDRQFTKNERRLRETLQNDELIKMLGLQKSLVYFSTSLKADESTLVRVKSGRVIRLYEEDRDLLDDVFIEFRQAIEMSNIYTGILESTMDTFGSIISNNLNIVMRTLTIVMLALSIPTIVFSFYGMNVGDLPFDSSWVVPLVIAVALLVGVLLIFRFSRKFK